MTITGNINLQDITVTSYDSLGVYFGTPLTNINNITWTSTAGYGIQFNVRPNIIRISNSSFTSSSGTYAGMIVNFIGSPITLINNTFLGTSSTNWYGQDIAVKQGAKLQLINATYTSVGLNIDGWVISRDHNKIANNWTIYGAMNSTDANSTGGFNGTNWTTSDNFNLALANAYGTYFPTVLNATNNIVIGNTTINNGSTLTGSNWNLTLGSININSGGAYNATIDITNITNGNFSNSGLFKHNSGRIIFGGGTGNNQSITGTTETTFFNLNITNGVVNTTIEQNTTIEGVLDIASGSTMLLDATDKQLYLTFGNESGGHTEAITTGTLFFAGNTINPVTIQGKNAMHQPQIKKAAPSQIDWDSGGSGSLVNLKWLHFNSSTIVITEGSGVTLNITGNISSNGGITLGAGDTLNITQPGTNISGFDNTANSYRIIGKLHMLGSASQPILILDNDEWLLDNGSTLNIQYATFSASANAAGAAVIIEDAPSIIKIDNITINSTNRSEVGGGLMLRNLEKDVLITNSTFAGEAPLDSEPKRGLAQQVITDESNFTCIRCNFSLVGWNQNPSQGWVLSVNATDPVTGLQTNNTNFWGVGRTSEFNATLGVNPANWTKHTNLTIHDQNGRKPGAFINTTLVVSENFTVTNITIMNNTFINISSNNAVNAIGYVFLNGTINLENGAGLNISQDLIIYEIGFLNSREGPNPITAGALNITLKSIVNGTAGTLNITNGNFTNSGSFTHNSGRVVIGGGTGENQTITGDIETTFFNLNITNGAVAVTQEQNTTIAGVLDVASGATYTLDGTDRVLVATFGNASGGTTKIINSGTLSFVSNIINPIKLIGASGQHPVKISGTDIDWDSGGLNSIINLGNLDFQTAATTGGGGVRLNVSAGNVSFASLALNNQDQLNISNSSNVTLTNSGAITLNGKINIVDGLLFNATYNNTIFTINGSNLFISDVASIPNTNFVNITNNDFNVSIIGRFLNITNLTNTAVIDLNFTYNLTSVSTANETNLSIQKYNDSTSIRWHNLSASKIDTVNKVIYIEDFTQSGSVFAPGIVDGPNIINIIPPAPPAPQQNKDKTDSSLGGGGGGLISLPGKNLEVDKAEIILELASNIPGVEKLTLTNKETSPIEINITKEGLLGVHILVATSAPDLSFDSSDTVDTRAITLQPGEKITIDITFIGKEKGTLTGKLILSWNIIGNLARSSIEIPVILEIESFKKVIDIALNIPSVFKNILKSGTLTYQINLINSGDSTEAQDITVNYFIKDFSGNKYYEENETLSITRQKTLIKSIKLPELTPGTYVLIAELTNNGEFATASSTFNVLGDIKSLLKEESFAKTIIAISLLFAMALLAIHMFKLRSRKQQLKLPRRLFK